MTTIIGKCRFEGKRPPRTTIHGRIKIHHSGDVRITKISGNKHIWTGTGDVWIIFKSKEDSEKNEFRVSGNVQTCMDF